MWPADLAARPQAQGATPRSVSPSGVLMDLTVREVATLLGRSSRTVRAQVARGELAGVKRNGLWRIPRQNLPLTEAQRRSLQSKAEALRQTVESVLPSRLALSPGQRTRSLADLEAFRSGALLLAELRAHGPAALPPLVLARVLQLFDRSLLALAEAAQHFERELKLSAIHRARTGLARVVALLLIEGGIPPAEPLFSWVVALENGVLPAVSGFARWADGLKDKRR